VKISAVVAVLRMLKKQQKKSTMLGGFSERKYSPYRILIGTILSARARDEVTEPVTEALFRRYPTSHSLAKANPRDVQKVIKRIGFYRQKTKSIMSTAKDICTKYKDKVPDTIEELMKLRGVGRKVANCVLVYAYGRAAIPVDTHVHHLSNHFGWVRTKSPEKTESALVKLIPKQHWKDVNDILVAHGKSINYRKFPHRGTAIEKHCKTCRR